MPYSSNEQFEQLNKLLQIKRLEKPSQEFWNRFDKELKQKTFKLLVKKEHPAKRMGKGIVVFFKNPTVSLSSAALFVLSFSLSSPSFTLLTQHSPAIAQELDISTQEINKILQSANVHTELVCENLTTSKNSDVSLMSGMVVPSSLAVSSFRMNTKY